MTRQEMDSAIMAVVGPSRVLFRTDRAIFIAGMRAAAKIAKGQSDAMFKGSEDSIGYAGGSACENVMIIINATADELDRAS